MKETKHIHFSIIFLLFALYCLNTNAGNNAKAILDKTAATINSAGDIKASFIATAFNGTTEQGSTSGTIYIHKNKIHLESENIKYWFDGTTLWAYMKENNEVNISNPTPEEQQTFNPYVFVNLYKQGYSYKQTDDTTIRGKQCYSIILQAKNKSKSIQEIRLTIDKSNYQPLCIRLRNNKSSWTRISITNCQTKQNFKASTFQFNSKDFPNVEQIDLR